MKISTSCALLLALSLGGCKPQAGKTAIEAREIVFPIGGLSGRPARDKAAGFSLAGPIYGNQAAFLAECEAERLPCVYTIGMPIDFLGRDGTPVTAIDKEQVREEIMQQVKAVAESEFITTWRIGPSELRHWKPAEMEYLKVASEAIREADPHKRPIYMYEPGHREQASLEKTLPFQDIAAKGVYPNYSLRRSQRAWVPWTIRQQEMAIATVNPNITPYAVLEMYKQPSDVFPLEEIPLWVRHDAYAALIGRIRGIVIYSFGNRKGFSGETPEWKAYYNAWTGVARELNGPLKLGSVFLNGKPSEAPAFEVISGAEVVVLTGSRSQPDKDTEVPALSTAAYDWGGHRYWFIVNSSENAMRIRLKDGGTAWSPLLEDQPSLSAASELELPGLAAAAFKK